MDTLESAINNLWFHMPPYVQEEIDIWMPPGINLGSIAIKLSEYIQNTRREPYDQFKSLHFQACECKSF